MIFSKFVFIGIHRMIYNKCVVSFQCFTWIWCSANTPATLYWLKIGKTPWLPFLYHFISVFEKKEWNLFDFRFHGLHNSFFPKGFADLITLITLFVWFCYSSIWSVICSKLLTIFWWEPFLFCKLWKWIFILQPCWENKEYYWKSKLFVFIN